MNQTKKQTIMKNLKPILDKYRVKGSLRVRNGHAITLTLRSGSINFVSDMYPTAHGKVVDKVTLMQNYNFMINQYWFHEHYCGESYHFIKAVKEAMESADYYDRSDAMIDYFDTAYYYDIVVGEWNKPYTVTK